MLNMRAPRLPSFGLLVLAAACGSNNGNGPGDGGTDGTTAADVISTDGPTFVHDTGLPTDSPCLGCGDGLAPQETGPTVDVTAIAINPSTATLITNNGGSGNTQFTVTATNSDGTTTTPFTNVVWTADHSAIGSIDQTGTFTANGTLGGTVNVTASFGSLTAKATLVVGIKYVQNPGNVPTSIQTSLQNATQPDPNAKWAYPYDLTVFPRGINQSTFMWTGANPTDLYYIQVKAPTFELESFASAPNLYWDFTQTAWYQFLNSTSGPAEVKVSRWDGAQAWLLTDEHIIVADGSMRGTIYYAAYYQQQGTEIGKVVRIKPGAVAFDDFLDAGTTCTSCHTVSANGGTIVYNEGNWPPELSNTLDLQSNTTVFSGFKNTNADAGASQWAMAGLSADGKTITENFAPLRGPIGVQVGAFDPTTGTPQSGSGISKQLWMPTFSPDNLLLAYVDATTSDLRAYDWDPVNHVASNDRLIVPSSANASLPQIQYPTISPDHQWIVYQRGPSLGSLGVSGDIYVASVTNPGAEQQLAALDGVGYPFAYGSRDQNLDYEPTFAPVAAGGYFWIAFHSRRTYGNKLVNPAYVSPGVGVKQLWVAAFDQSPTPGKDPSHPPFYLGGQSTTALNTRGYWALPPCEPDGQQCQTGTDCCGGYCDGISDAGVDGGDGGPVSVCGQPTGGSCSQNGDKCTKTADCCNAPTGVTCINGVCSEPPPPPDAGSSGVAF